MTYKLYSELYILFRCDVCKDKKAVEKSIDDFHQNKLKGKNYIAGRFTFWDLQSYMTMKLIGEKLLSMLNFKTAIGLQCHLTLEIQFFLHNYKLYLFIMGLKR